MLEMLSGLFSKSEEPEEQQDDLSSLDELVTRIRNDHPDLVFDVRSTGEVIVPKATMSGFPRHVSYLRHEVESVLGNERLRVLTNPSYEAEVRSTTDEADENQLGAENLQMVEILELAIQKGASDTYIDVHPNRTYYSYRVNGIKLPAEPGYLSTEQGFDICRALWSKGNESYEERIACDCSFTYRDMRFRGNALPTYNGGSGVVLRMRDPGFYLPLEECGYSDRQIEAIKAASESPGGLILLTGETNSGKSSTMATLMGMLPSTTKTIEISDPIEVNFPHITQVSIPRYEADADERFMKALAGLVRQNPDTLILGEIRDKETSDAAMQMALQGKRVISTLHTQSCVLAFARLSDLGMDPTLIYKAGFIASVINQNLVPRLCDWCKQPEHPDPAIWDAVGPRHNAMFEGKARYASGKSCGEPKCEGGVVGQTLVAEVFPMYWDRDGEVIEFLRLNRTKDAIAKISGVWGMESKHQHAFAKVMDGICDPCLTESIIGRFTKDTDSVYPKKGEI